MVGWNSQDESFIHVNKEFNVQNYSSGLFKVLHVLRNLLHHSQIVFCMIIYRYSYQQRVYRSRMAVMVLVIIMPTKLPDFDLQRENGAKAVTIHDANANVPKPVLWFLFNQEEKKGIPAIVMEPPGFYTSGKNEQIQL